MEILNDKNFLQYCLDNYDNPSCVDEEEFIEDINRIKYIKKLITKYKEKGELRERLILNHFIILANVFGPKALVRIVFLKMEDMIFYVKPFLDILNIMPHYVQDVKKEGSIDTRIIAVDTHIQEVLSKI